MKRNLQVLLWLLLPISMSAQSVSPVETNEYCPSTSLSFTFTAPGSYPSATISSLGNANVVSQSNNGSGVISATIQFGDYNNTQPIRLNYNDGSGGYADFNFSKIKSLFYSDALNDISPNISSISASQCQSQNISISFSNISYVNPYTSPKLTYGTITSYQYSLPTG